jgi:hypothetical protein
MSNQALGKTVLYSLAVSQMCCYCDQSQKSSKENLRFEVLMMVKMSIMVFWVVLVCGFGGGCHCSYLLYMVFVKSISTALLAATNVTSLDGI